MKAFSFCLKLTIRAKKLNPHPRTEDYGHSRVLHRRILCIIKLAGPLDIMKFKSFYWLSHQGLCVGDSHSCSSCNPKNVTENKLQYIDLEYCQCSLNYRSISHFYSFGLLSAIHNEVSFSVP